MKRSVFTFTLITCILLACLACSSIRKSGRGIIKHEKYIDVGTHRIRFVISDLPSDYTIILESGGGRFSDVYEGIQDTLAKLSGYRVISYDRSGFGKSELGPADLTAPGEVQVLRKCHEEMVMKSPEHKLVIAEGNGHDIMTENPELVLNTIIGLAGKVRLK